MQNKIFTRSILTASLMTFMLLTACGGGGGAVNGQAVISGTATGSITAGVSEVTGTLSVADSDVGQSAFAQPTSLAGTYGTWSFAASGSTATWRYTLTATPTSAATETLTVKSQDGSAVQNITVSIAAGSSTSSPGLITTVAAPTYTGSYASEKLAVFNRLNDDRARCGFGKLAQNSKLDLAAQNHATYLALNKTSGHSEQQGLSGFTGSDFGARLAAVGYQYGGATENVSGVSWGTWFQGSDFSTTEVASTTVLKRLYATVYHLSGLMVRDTEVGFGVANAKFIADGSSNGKMLVVNSAFPMGNTTGQLLSTDAVQSFPCDGIQGLSPAFKSDEDPDPFPGVNRDLTPYGQPIYVTSGPTTTITLMSGTVTLRGGAAVPTTTLTSSNDPHARLQANQVFLVPTVRLANNATYDVSMSGTSSGLVSSSNPTGAWTKAFSFTTGTVLSE